jgi:hypothetical protein
MEPLPKAYLDFTRRVPDLPVFVQPWYLDAVCGDRWSAVVVEKGGQVAAALPYHWKKVGPWTYLATPPLCKFLGPYFAPSFRTVSQQYKLTDQLIDGLPPFACFKQNAHYTFDNWLPFYWRGFRQTTRYSYVLDPVNRLEEVRSGFSTDYRNNKIPRAEAEVRLIHDLPVALLYELLQATYGRQGLGLPISRSFLERLWQSVRRENAGRLFFAQDAAGRVQAGLLLIWDRRSAYLLVAADDPALRQGGAGVWLTWQAIRYTHEVLGLSRFDFLGSMKRPIERARRQFGARPEPYAALEKYNSRLYQALDFVRGGWKF